MQCSRRAFVALHCLGYGLFLLSYCSTVPLLAFFNQAVDGWGQVLLVQFGFFAALSIGCLGVRALLRKGSAPSARVANLASSTAVCACFVGAFLLATPKLAPGTALCLTLAMGISSAYPLMFWFNGLSSIYRNYGRVACITTLAGSGLIAVVVALAASPLRDSRLGLLAVFISAELVCAGCRWALGAKPAGLRACGGLACERYRLTSYSLSMLASLGVTVGLTGGYIVYFCATDQGMASGNAVSLAPVVVFAVVAVLVRFMSEKRQPHFGMVARLLISITGFALALLPIFGTMLPGATFALFKTVFALQGIVMMLFSIEVACENGLDVLNVMPVNYAFYSLMACVGAVVFWVSQTFVGGHTAWEIVAAAGVLATVMVIPMLPATSSAATAFTLEELPENEGRARRMGRVRDGLAGSFGLTGREAEVLGLLMEGRSRREIAEALTLSGWTVKDYMSSIYRKTGVHSYQELMAIVQKEGQERQ